MVAGVSCTEVLEKLSDYIDTAGLTETERAQIEAHLAGCSWCEQFGGAFAGVVAGLRKALSAPPAVPEAVLSRLENRLDEEP